jgi:predicted ester cyclase
MNDRTRLALIITCVALAACSGEKGSSGDGSSTPQGSVAVGDSAQMIAQNLAKFDTLDYDVFSHQKFDRFKESHAEDIIVTWPDGHETHGLPKHIEDMKALFVAMPDLAIKEHPIKIANGSWTAVVGHMTGTFSKPMPMGSKTISPNGKKLDLSMATIGHWTKAGVMDHEWLFWDNATYMGQLGLSK